MKVKSFLLMFLISCLLSTHPASAAANPNPQNWQDSSIYYLMIDRFNDGDTKNNIDVNTNDPLVYNGGDFQGIIDKLDYIKSMGFNVISLTPIFENAPNGYHGYWVQNYYNTDKHFGSIKTFQELVQEAHKRHIKVMIDFIANNVAPSNPLAHDPGKKSWFHPKQSISTASTNQQELENSWINGLPDLNQDNPQVKNYLINASKWWIKKTNIDGYHLIDVNYAPVQFWRDFSREVKKEKKDFYLLGDIQSTDPSVISKYKDTGIDGFDNTVINQDLRKGFATTDRPLNTLFSNWAQNIQNDKNPYLMGNYMDDPFSSRFTKEIVANKQFPGARWKMALTYLYTAPGIPIIYYGTEIALNGGNPPDNRRQMNFRAEQDLIDYITQLSKIRQQLPELTRGTMKKLYEKNGMLVYKRVYKKETVVVAINNTKKSQQVTLSSNQLEDGKELRGLLNGDLSQSKDKQYKLILDRDNAEIYVLADKAGSYLPFFAAVAVVSAAFLIFLYFILKRRNRFGE